MSELKPCPFCGGRARAYDGDANCKNKDCLMHDDWPSVEKWNTRATPELPDGYRVENGRLLFPEGGEMARIAPDGWFKISFSLCDQDDARALAAFLQGRDD